VLVTGMAEGLALLFAVPLGRRVWRRFAPKAMTNDGETGA